MFGKMVLFCFLFFLINCSRDCYAGWDKISNEEIGRVIGFLIEGGDLLMNIKKSCGTTIHRGTGEKVVDIEGNRKGDGTLVTKADTDSNDFFLGKFKEYFKDVLVVSEEVGKDSHEEPILFDGEDKCIFLDPLDGTRNFINNGDRYGILVTFMSISENGEGYPELGFIYLPEKKLMAWGGMKYETKVAIVDEGDTVEDIVEKSVTKTIAKNLSRSNKVVISKASNYSDRERDYFTSVLDIDVSSGISKKKLGYFAEDCDTPLTSIGSEVSEQNDHEWDDLGARLEGFTLSESSFEVVYQRGIDKLFFILDGKASFFVRLGPKNMACWWDFSGQQALIEGAGGWFINNEGVRYCYLLTDDIKHKLAHPDKAYPRSTLLKMGDFLGGGFSKEEKETVIGPIWHYSVWDFKRH